jgi:hypothetical protein
LISEASIDIISYTNYNRIRFIDIIPFNYFLSIAFPLICDFFDKDPGTSPSLFHGLVKTSYLSSFGIKIGLPRSNHVSYRLVLSNIGYSNSAAQAARTTAFFRCAATVQNAVNCGSEHLILDLYGK